MDGAPLGTPPTIPLCGNGLSDAADERPLETASTCTPTFRGKNNATTDRIPRPANAFILFRADFTRNHTLPDGIERRNGTLSKIASSEWKNLSPEGRGLWYRRADEAKIAHQARYPDYKFRPVHRKSTKNKSKAPIDVRKDAEEGSAAPKEGPPTSSTDDGWMQGCSMFSVWRVDGDDALRGRGRPPKGLPPPSTKPKTARKPGAKPVRTASQSGLGVLAEEKEARERRRAYFEQLHARGVSSEAAELAAEAWDDAHSLNPARALSSASDVDANAAGGDDESSESESETDGVRRRPSPLSTGPPAPGRAPPRMIASSSSLNRDHLLAHGMYAPGLPRYTFVMEATSERAATHKTAEGAASSPNLSARREGLSPGYSLPLPQAQDSFERRSDEWVDEEMVQKAVSASMMSSTNKRIRPPPSTDGCEQRERTLDRDALPTKRPRLNPFKGHRTNEGADGDYDMHDAAEDSNGDDVEWEHID
ncbi:uncharacterized protein SCHCODRAFT_02598731 [Schizophyllum commune H4-8]|uniref:HMG box domain-containing protein n=1 Tax=Schizophyllum commune (strain H4-8 / FGSC 9210) TaxID=578458 RepID=D8QM82_SCHCM|nr:uncharacterized protein SCHCODRAFT_02598731 [Schizophyllum commune H4-8]KAI5892959.1 hypothetical protein SCHCODRAFT_02598731 [Schizophyllum commune H4-8]